MGRKNNDMEVMIKEATVLREDLNEVDAKSWMDHAKQRLREWLRVKADVNKTFAKLVSTQRGMTSKQIQRARQDWVKSGRKVLWIDFLQTRRAEIDKKGGLMIHGASLA